MEKQQAYDIINEYLEEMDATITEASKDGNRIEVINAVIKNHSMEHGFLRLFLDLDYQVCNGGFEQYTGNGYHSTEQAGCTSDVSEEADIHERLVELSKEFFEKYDIPQSEEFMSIITTYKVEIDTEYEIEEDCEKCSGSGTVTEQELVEDEDGEEYYEDTEEECGECGGCGWVDIHNPQHGCVTSSCSEMYSKLDDRYYAINDDLIVEIAKNLK